MKNYSEIVAALDAADCKYKTDARFDALTTFRIGGAIPLLILPDSAETLKKALSVLKTYDMNYFVLGHGSNLLAPDDGVAYPVVSLTEGEFSSVRVEGETITAGAGALLVSVCNAALAAELSGLETVYGIPGSVGGGVYMNAGAYGGELADTLETVYSMTADGEIIARGVEALNLSYRHSLFMENGEIVLQAVFRLQKSSKEAVKAAMEDYISRRRDKQPLQYPSAGSVFRRPAGHFAGALIEQAGLKGCTVGGAQVSEKHAGFIVNIGGATAEDVSALIRHIQQTVFAASGVRLEPEILCLR
ncbi:MAG: UDP-N-acetylmuramate dehydrogenase [Clostridia bacterium]|nr:UDP-N-acetylmuramate dehydrogenase [Clostridia bacterium]